VEQRTHLNARQVSAQAEVRPVAEGEVRVRCPPDVEVVRLPEDRRITVGRGERDDHLVVLPDPLPAEFVVSRRRPAERHDRGPPAQHLVNGGMQQGGVRAELALFGGVVEQGDARAGQAIAEGLVPGDREQPEHVLELGRRHAVRLG
jgi:hypothetical protein